MTRMGTALVAVLALGLLVPHPASAEGDSDAERMKNLEQRLMALEDKLEASTATIDAQRELLREHSAPAVSQGSALDEFFSGLEVGGRVTASYIHNFGRPDTTTARTQPLGQFNLDHESFKLDAAKIEIGKAAAEPGTAGFQLDILWGDNADILGGVGSADDRLSYIQQAYALYNYEGIQIAAGKWETLLGYELIDSTANPNISHGLLFTWAIPLHHTGLLASGNVDENVGWALGVANGFNNVTDTNDNKALLAQINFTQGPLFGSVSGYYGADGGFTNTTNSANVDDQYILDIIASYDIGDQTHLWINFDYGRQQDVVFASGPFAGQGPKDAGWWGVAVGAKHQLSDQIYAAVRAEHFKDEEGYRLFGSGRTAGFNSSDVSAQSLTGTLGMNLTQALLARAELRYDRIEADRDQDEGFKFRKNGNTDDNQWLGIVEVSYNFD